WPGLPVVILLSPRMPPSTTALTAPWWPLTVDCTTWKCIFTLWKPGGKPGGGLQVTSPHLVEHLRVIGAHMQRNATVAADGRGSAGASEAEWMAGFENVHVAFPDANRVLMPVLDGLDLDIHAGTFTAIIGPSGCGKTTILNLLADVIKPTSGNVRIRGAEPGS